MEKQTTMAATARINTSTEDGIDFLCEKVKEYDGDVQVLSTRQIASNLFEMELFLTDITDLYLLGVALGRKFPESE
jgi:hypothetical protein